MVRRLPGRPRKRQRKLVRMSWERKRDFSGAALQTRSIGHGVTKKELVLERFKVQKCTPFGSVLGGQKGVISLSSA